MDKVSRKRLWETEHSYYCNDTNYHSNKSSSKYYSVEDMLEDWGNSDPEYNLLFRWDWNVDECYFVDVDDGEEKGEIICLYFMLQRKGIFKPVMARIDPDKREEEEEKLYSFIKSRWPTLNDFWNIFIEENKP